MKWKNVPIPEGHLIPLIVGIVLQIRYPQNIAISYLILSIIGGTVVIAALMLVGWCVYEVNSININSPKRLITSGPYRYSRNPMYVAWSLIFFAAVLLFNSIWLLILFPIVLIYTHMRVILPEEEHLSDQFGAEYLAYKSRVRRYI